MLRSAPEKASSPSPRFLVVSCVCSNINRKRSLRHSDAANRLRNRHRDFAAAGSDDLFGVARLSGTAAALERLQCEAALACERELLRLREVSALPKTQRTAAGG